MVDGIRRLLCYSLWIISLLIRRQCDSSKCKNEIHDAVSITVYRV